MPCVRLGVLAVALVCCLTAPARAERLLPPGVWDSVVSVLPLWPGYEQGGSGDIPPGAAPEGSAVAIRPGGYLVTARHVVARAVRIDVRLNDGRLLPADVIASDRDSDLAVLRVEADLPPLPLRHEPGPSEEVCAIGNQFGLGLSVSCGVVSAVRLTAVGFNAVEDFVQTDAVLNPGSSGGALVDREGRLVGVLSAIFTKESDANIGVNFAASAALVDRVADDLIALGHVAVVDAGFRVAELRRSERRDLVGARVVAVSSSGPAAHAGLRRGDVLVAVGGRRIGRASDVTAALYLQRPGDGVAIDLLREGEPAQVQLELPQ